MQGKGIIKFFLVAIALVCLLQYLFYLPTTRIEKAANAYAAKVAATAPADDKDVVEKEARISFLDSMSSETVFRIPGIKSYTYDELKRQELALGLDLKGGMSTVLQVDLKDFLSSLSNHSKDPAFVEALNKTEKRLVTEQVGFVKAFGQEWAKVANGKTLASIFAKSPSLKDDIRATSSDNQVLNAIQLKADQTVDLTFKRLKDRIDKFGVTQPNVSLDAARDMIVVELPGVDNPERARKFLQASAKLEFFDVYRASDAGVLEGFANADKTLKALKGGDSTTVTAATTKKDTIWDKKTDSLGTVIDSTMRIVDVPVSNTMADAGPLFKIFTPNSATQQGIAYPLAVMGVADKNKRNLVDEYLALPQIKALFPADISFKWSSKPTKDPVTFKYTNKYELYGIKVPRSGKAPLEGDRVVDARETQDQMSNQVAVSLRMDNEGAKKWGEMTTKAAADNNREIAIVLDGEVVSAPRVNNAITSGDSQITGDFSVQEGKDLANILQIGKLPAGTKIVQETLVGPSLGQENINKSLVAILIGFFFIMIFMIAYYSTSGVIAVISLLCNMFFIFGVLASKGTVITLPGIAGILLTMGIAVDVSVIIFEWVKEELKHGYGLKEAIARGFKHSYSAIIDANIITLITNICLAYFGLGPVKGFAVVMIVGVLSSLFTAVLVGRLITDWWAGKGHDIKFSTPFSDKIIHGANINWMGLRKKAYLFSSTIVLIGLISIFTRGFELGVDMKGGYSTNVSFADDVKIDPEVFKANLKKELGGEPIVKAVDVENTYNVTTSYKIDDPNPEVGDEVLAKVHKAVQDVTKVTVPLDQFKKSDSKGTHISSFSKVGPTVADDIKMSSVTAAFLALLAIFIYILFRFSRWQFSLGAIIALAHDSLVMLGIFSLLHGLVWFSMEIDQAFIAAILTVIGYSMNDTVIIFDRIREFAGKNLSMSKTDVINAAINSTLGRTIITSFITFTVMTIMFVFGGASIKGFAFAIMVGIFFGTFSSIFIAGAIVHDFAKDIRPKSVAGHSDKK
ncbi:MAG: protein translocase subunit SecDF [Saprospiraceae bacterium]|nr:protein translocase subunit SecDF [Saprospiraceae bacterium]